MLKRIVITALVAICSLFAQNGETWNTSETVYQVSTIDLEPNVDAQYLNQMKRTWGTNMKVLKAEGLIEDYHIYKSVNQYDGDYDLSLTVKMLRHDDNDEKHKADHTGCSLVPLENQVKGGTVARIISPLFLSSRW